MLSWDSWQGVVFSVRPPRKSWKAIANLSGGEKTLASLALVFALHHYKPTPLYVMDEIDAALGAPLSLHRALPSGSGKVMTASSPADSGWQTAWTPAQHAEQGLCRSSYL